MIEDVAVVVVMGVVGRAGTLSVLIDCCLELLLLMLLLLSLMHD